MKKLTLLLSALLIVSLSVLAQIKMIVHLNDADSVEFYASSVDSITFANFSIDSEIPDDADKPTPILPNANGYEYVDLGLPSGTLWATCNVGAATPESYGGLYAWGETKTKSLYTWDTYAHCNGSTSNYISKYTKNDEKTQLERNDDVAYLSRGGDWRMPTYDEFAELRWHCTWKYSVRNNVSGYEVVGQNNNSIFLPFSGYQYEDQLSRGTCGSYWTSTLGNMYEETDYVADRAGALYFDISDKTMEETFRDAGRAIRPVLKVKYQIVFNANEGEGFMTSMKVEGRRIELPMNTFTREGYFFIGWNTKADGSGDNYSDGQNIQPTEDLTLYAQWEKIQYFTVSFDANGGTGSMSSMTFGKGETKTLTANTFTRTGYTFIGWNTKSDGSGTSYTNKQSITPTENLTLYAQWEESKDTGTANGHDWVDLGLPSGTKWATTNVGASTPEGYGNYYAWGETTTKSSYNWSTYKWCNGSSSSMTKYCTSSSYGTVDNKTTLDLSDDAAYVNWGTSWRMPTKAEQDELRNTSYTTWTWTTQNGVNGYKVTSKTNGNSIFLPAAGCRNDSSLYSAGSNGNYWSSSLDTSNSSSAYGLYFSSSNVDWDGSSRNCGLSVRAVLR